jgi:hypothetical protein
MQIQPRQYGPRLAAALSPMSGDAAPCCAVGNQPGKPDATTEAAPCGQTSPGDRQDELDAHSLFGYLVTSDLTLQFAPTACCRGAPDLAISRQDDLATDAFRRTSPVYVSQRLDPYGEPWFALYQTGGRDVLAFAKTGEIAITDELIQYRPIADERLPWLAQILLGTGLSFWLERRSIVVLHASVVDVDDHAVAFLATSGSGKSTLAAAFVSTGHPLISDDLLAIRADDSGLWALPGLPGMRLWPAEAARLAGDAQHLPRVLPGIEKRWVSTGPGGYGPFAQRPVPVGCILLPSRVVEEVDGVELGPVRPRDGFVELARHSFAGRLAVAAGLAMHRTSVLARLTASVPIAGLRYSDGLDRLPEVVKGIETAVRRLRSGAIP